MISTLMILLCVAARIVPHPPNLTPVGATAVFAGRTLSLPRAILVTLTAMFLSDLALAALRGYPLFHVGTLFVYAGFAVQIILGAALRQRRGGALLAAGAGSLAFFALSNFGVFLGTLYPHTLAGLGTCYAMALPFFGGTLIGDLAWTVVLTQVHRVLSHKRELQLAAAAR